jgi:hypothetical protein
MYLSIKRRHIGAVRSREDVAHEAARDVVRRSMNDVADGLLLDVHEMSITDLEFSDTGSALNKALARILSSNPGCSFNSFNASV